MGIISDVAIIHAKIMHHRLRPKVNKFLYSAFYLCLPLDTLDKSKGSWIFGWNRPAVFSFYARDHGENGGNLRDWVSALLAKSEVREANINSIQVITMPRILGYVFNPISFWIVPNDKGEMLAAICEVNNTFGERHVYVCAHKDGQAIQPADILEAHKIFHVSPFLQREGSYQFRFSFKENFFAAFVDYIGADKSPVLLTSVAGTMQQATNGRFLYSFFAYPFMTLKVIFLIHWQALVILSKGIKYVPKPLQLSKKYSMTDSNV